MVQLLDYAGALGRAQGLVPDTAEQDLRQRVADMQLQTQGLQNQQVQQQIDVTKQTQDRAALFQQRARAFLDHDGKFGDPAPLLLEFPEFGKQIKDAFTAQDEATQTASLRDITAVYGLASNGKPEVAAQKLKARMDAERAAGTEVDAVDQALYDQLSSGDPKQIKQAQNMIALQLSAIVGPDKFGTTFGKLDEADPNKGFTLSPGAKRFDADGKVVAEAPFAPRLEKRQNPDGSIDHVEYQPGEGGDPASGGGGASGGSGVPRSVRNNNPGNIVDSAFAKKQPGYVGNDGRFAKFANPGDGANAQAALLGSYIDRGFNTVGKIIGRWAPPSENDTGAYVRRVAKELGVNPADTLTKAVIPRLQAAITKVEGGPGGSSGVTAPAQTGPRVVFTSKPPAANPVDDATVQFYAQKIAEGGDLPALGSGKEAAAWRQSILKRAAQIQQGQGISGGDSNLRQADVKAARQALGQLQKTRSNVEGFERTFMLNVDQVLKLAPKGVAGSAPVFNRWIQSGRKSISGDPAVSAFNVAVNTAANEYAKLASGASGGAVTSDSARHEAMDILNNAQTLPQLQAAIRQMKIDGHNRILALNEQEGRLRGTIAGGTRGVAPGGGGQPAPAAQPSGGTPAGAKPVGRDPRDGRIVYERNGKRFKLQ